MKYTCLGSPAWVRISAQLLKLENTFDQNRPLCKASLCPENKANLHEARPGLYFLQCIRLVDQKVG